MPSQWDAPEKRTFVNELLGLIQQLLEDRLPFLRGRPERIERACELLADAAGIDQDKRFALSIASRYHDIGLLGVPDALLMKTGRLTPAEMLIVRRHTSDGGRMVAKLLPDVPDAVEAIWYHHECADGTGFHGLQENQIPPLAAIIGMGEAIEAMANHRPYRPALTLPRIVEEVRFNIGRQFTKQVAEAFLSRSEEIVAATRDSSIGAAHPPRRTA